MDEIGLDEANPNDGEQLNEFDELATAIGIIIENTLKGYWLSDSDARQGIRESFEIVSLVLEAHGELTLNAVDRELMINDRPVLQHNTQIEALRDQLHRLEVDSFGLIPGLTGAEFEALIEILTLYPAELEALGGFGQALQEGGVTHVRAKKILYQRLAEDEVVVSREVLEEVAGGSEGEFDKLVALLQGRSGEINLAAAKQLRELAEKGPDELADMIVEAAQGPAGAPDGGGATAERVVECLNRTYETLAKDPAIKTQKGKKEVSKIIGQLESDLLLRMREATGELTTADSDAVSEAVESITDELQIDALADAYMKKRKAIESNEKRILRFIKKKGFDKISQTDLEGRLTEAGLTIRDWEDLLEKSGLSAPGVPPEAQITAMGNLAALLESMERTAPSEGIPVATAAPPIPMAQVVTQVDREVRKLIGETEGKIAELVQEVKAEQAEQKKPAAKRRKRGMTMAKLIEILAEICQELCQPLVVINCSLDMVRTHKLGEVTEDAAEMLNLAATSSQRLQKVIDRLMGISGVPKGRSPDKHIQDSIFKG